MATALARGRARSDIEVMSRAGLPLHRFMDEAADSLGAVVPFVAACVTTLDPATAMVSSARKLGVLDGRNEQDLAWSQLEYGGEEPTAIRGLLRAGRTAVGMNRETHGDVTRSARMAELLVPHFDFHDEARVVFADRSGGWGHLSLFRGSEDQAFGAEELAFLADVAPSFTRGFRTGLLAQIALRSTASEAGPAVIIVDAQNRMIQSTPGAQAHLERMSALPGMGDPFVYVHALVDAARRLARGDTDRVPRVRTRTADGLWLVLHAAPLGGLSDRGGDVVVTIEEARPQEVIDLVAAAFGLTPRERDVISIVLRGANTKEIAAEMHVSPYTVQDHLKSIFDKADVTSRRELVARVYFDQYLSRAGSELAPSGWYAIAH
ncbi:helix-turn-helix transcriptional regulator [Microbacterium lacus]|uniref:LuxR C-terminal-related transcriptional regulator n=1 Tax=Microbacterium lacus TaxID=415217 RepID=A0ABP4RX30_9MICO